MVYDALASFEAGINSGKYPLLLDRNQCAFSVSATYRGDLATNRPPYLKQNLVFASASVQSGYQQGLWQGGCYYQPDAGPQQIIVSISGRIFRLIPDNLGNAAVDEITIPNDPNSATQPQAWLWQAEKWVIIQNGGVNQAIIYDGISCRRSVPVSQIVGTLAAPFTAPDVGGKVTVALTSNYTGLLNSTVEVVNTLYPTQAYYQALVSGTNQVVLQNLYGSTGGTVPAGDDLTIEPASLGYLVNVSGNVVTLAAPVPANLPHFRVIINAVTYTVDYTAGSPILTLHGHVSGISVGNLVFISGVTAPNIVAATVAAPFTVPAQGANVTVTINQPITAPVGQTVFIGNFQFGIVSVPALSANTVTLENLNDASGTVYNPGSTLQSIPELPAGRMGTYGMGRNWICLTDGISFMAGDIVGGSSGAPAYNYRDAVLKSTENSYLAGGGTFHVPGAGQQITALVFASILDASQGTGTLQVFTNENVFGCNAPVDRATWQTLTNPILVETLIGSGAVSQECVVRVNGDMIFRSANPNGVRSLTISRLDFLRWNNTPMSFEMSRVIDLDNLAGLPYCSAIQFDNRVLTTCSPVQTAQGVYHPGFLVLNLDSVSTLGKTDTPIWDSMWSGVNSLRLITGVFGGTQRAFAVTLNTSVNQIELHEIMPQGDLQLDNGINPVVWVFEGPVLFKEVKGKGYYDLVRLQDGEIYLSDLDPGSTVKVQVDYRPDFSLCWFPWTTFSVCADPASTIKQFRSRLGLGKPSALPCEESNGQPSCVGRWFQFRFTFTGHCVFMGGKFAASLEPEPQFARPAC